MLVVLLILLVATASAAVSVANTQAELQAAGNERVALQTRYVAEAALATTLSWIDQLSFTGQWQRTWRTWENNPPPMTHYAEPEIPTNLTHHASRNTQEQVLVLQQNPSVEVPGLTNAAPLTTGGSGGSGGAGGGGGTGGGGGGGGTGGSGAASTDTTGSFGPKQGFGLPTGGFVVDVTDCQQLPGALTAGMQISSGGSSPPVGTFECVLTARGRLEPLGNAASRDWALGNRTFTQSVFASAHDARAVFITPETFL